VRLASEPGAWALPCGQHRRLRIGLSPGARGRILASRHGAGVRRSAAAG